VPVMDRVESPAEDADRFQRSRGILFRSSTRKVK
jgi:hypothetical protein